MELLICYQQCKEADSPPLSDAVVPGPLPICCQGEVLLGDALIRKMSLKLKYFFENFGRKLSPST